MSDFLAETRRQMADRVAELEPAVAEHGQLQTALDALHGKAQGQGPATNRPRRPGRQRGSGTRSREALEVVTEQPGLSAAEVAERMGISVNYLYRVLPALEEEGKVRRQGRGWHPA